MLAHLQAEGVTRERLAGYDRAIREEPSFSAAQAPGLRRDLAEYLTTLKVRHPVMLYFERGSGVWLGWCVAQSRLPSRRHAFRILYGKHAVPSSY